MGAASYGADWVHKAHLLELVLIGDNSDTKLPPITGFKIEFLYILSFFLAEIHLNIVFKIGHLGYTFVV